MWTFIQSRSLCFALTNCNNGQSRIGFESGPPGCATPSTNEFQIGDSLDTLDYDSSLIQNENPPCLQTNFNCIGRSNVIRRTFSPTTDDCDKFCNATVNGCNMWTFIQSRSLCFALTNCNNGQSRIGFESGPPGCVTPNTDEFGLIANSSGTLDNSLFDNKNPSCLQTNFNCIGRLGGSNIIRRTSSPTADDCDKFCNATVNGCNMWTFIQSRSLCFALTDCNNGQSRIGFESGPPGCLTPNTDEFEFVASSKVQYDVNNRMDESVDCKIIPVPSTIRAEEKKRINMFQIECRTKTQICVTEPAEDNYDFQDIEIISDGRGGCIVEISPQ